VISHRNTKVRPGGEKTPGELLLAALGYGEQKYRRAYQSKLSLSPSFSLEFHDTQQEVQNLDAETIMSLRDKQVGDL
jgi:hypothetical protein